MHIHASPSFLSWRPRTAFYFPLKITMLQNICFFSVRMARTPPECERGAFFHVRSLCAVCRCYKTYVFFQSDSPWWPNGSGVVHMFWCRSYKMNKTRGSGDSHHRSDVLFTALCGGPLAASRAYLRAGIRFFFLPGYVSTYLSSLPVG